MTNIKLYRRHLGDEWANLQYCLVNSTEDGIRFNCASRPVLNWFRRIINLIDLRSTPAIDLTLGHKGERFDFWRRKGPQHRSDGKAYACKYLPTKAQWDLSPADPYKICFSFDGSNPNNVCGRWIRPQGFKKTLLIR